MEASELRIGNYVFGLNPENHSKKEVDTIATIYKYGWVTLGGKEGIEPIPLTDDWLRKFGFKKVAENDFILGKFSLYYVLYYDGYRVSEIIPKYVHQLQNLYFALTGEELTLKQ
jgi:hypothetical protein